MIVADEQVRRNLRRERVFSDQQNPLDFYDEVDIIHRYRLDRKSIISFSDLFEESLERPAKGLGVFLHLYNSLQLSDFLLLGPSIE